MQRSSPRASAGLSMLPASIAPSAAPAPTSVCSSSMKRITAPSDDVTSLRTALSRSSNSPRYLLPATIAPRSSAIDALVLEAFGHVTRCDPLREPLGDGGLADAGLADEHRVVLGPARQHLDDAADLVVAADDRVELAPPRRLGEVAPVLLERLVLGLGVRVGDALRAAHRLERRVDAIGRDACLLEQTSGFALGLGAEREQEMLGGDVLVLEAAHLLERGHQHGAQRAARPAAR